MITLDPVQLYALRKSESEAIEVAATVLKKFSDYLDAIRF